MRRGLMIAAIACSASACTTESIELPQAPNAFAGFDAFVQIGSPVALDASLSSDPDGDALSFSWRVAASPEGSHAEIADASARIASIVPDVLGTWVVSLSASDGRLVSRDLVAFTATASVATSVRPRASVEPRSSNNRFLSQERIRITAVTSDDGTVEAYALRVPAGATGEELSLMTADREISFVAPRPGEYWIAALLKNDAATSPPVIATVAVFDDAAAHPRADIEAPQTATKNARVLFDGRGSDTTAAPAAALTWRLIADPSNGVDALLDVATGCPAGMCRLLLPSKLGLYVVALEVEGGVTAVHALEVIE